MIKATNIYALTAKIPAWRYDPNISRKNDCRVFRLDYSDRTALASRHNCPHEGPGWKVQIIGQLPYYYSDRLTLDEITEGVKADIDFLAQPVVVIEKPQPANVLEDLADNLADNGHRMTAHEERQPW